jgi:argininosuccinate lyase
MVGLGLAHLDMIPEACMRALRDGDAVATDLAEALVARGIPFRDAYSQVGALVASQRAKGLRLADLRAIDLDAAGLPRELLALLDPAASARKRAETSEG